jgi:superfamily II DNA or RNA helicase
MSRKDEIQLEAKEAWLNSVKCNTIVLGTGGGKSKVAIDIVNTLKAKHVLILVNSIALVDSWRVELTKYYEGSITRDRTITVDTYQSAYKWSKVFCDMIIYDEVDFAVSPEYSKVFSLKAEYKLGLTGFVPAEKMLYLGATLPICYTKTAQELQEEGVLNRSELIFVEYPLSRIRTIKVPLKKGGAFYQSENEYYAYYHKQVQQAQIALTHARQEYKIYQLTDTSDNDLRDLNELKKVEKAEFKVKMMVAKRKKILNSLQSSLLVVGQLVEQIEEDRNNKIVIFCGVTDQCDRLGYPTYHGKKSSTEKDLSNLNSGKINVLGVCKAIDRGVNLIGVNYLIKESFDGSEVAFHQTHG